MSSWVRPELDVTFNPKCRVGRTARLGERGDALLFLQPIEVDYLQDLKKHGVLLTEYQLQKVLDSFPTHGQKPFAKNVISIDLHPWVMSLQKALEAFILSKVYYLHADNTPFEFVHSTLHTHLSDVCFLPGDAVFILFNVSMELVAFVLKFLYHPNFTLLFS